MKLPSLISVVGPTALGKTRLAISLARHFRTEILSADSRQFYREMKIGTAAPDREELAAAPHHFIGHLSIRQEYSVGSFEKDALNLLSNLFARLPVVVMVGGSGLYLRAVTHGLDEFPAVPDGIRQTLKDRLEREGIQSLQEELARLDPDYFREVDTDNPQRIIRALEVALASGKPFSSFRSGRKTERPFRILTVGLTAERDELYRRINTRVDEMLTAGLLEEAKALYPHRQKNALQTVGYKELFAYFEGRYDLETAVSEIKKNTRRYAKRQETWFRKNPDIQWFDYRVPPETCVEYLEEKLNEGS